MAKITRVFQKVFGLNGDQSHFGQFGSKAAGSALLTKDPTAIQAQSAFDNNGWLDAINAANKAPFLEDMNGLFLLAFRQIAYLMQDGIPEWNIDTPYFTGSIVRKTGTTELYGSAVDNNTANALPAQTSNGFWTYLNPQTVPAGAGADYFGGVVPVGWLLCDGSVVAQATYPALFSAIGATWNTGGEGAGNFRLPDMRGRASIGAGQGAGLTNRTLAQLIGEETHILVVGEMPAHAHGVTDAGHHHAVLGATNGTGNVGINTPPTESVIPGSSNFTTGKGYYDHSAGGGSQLIQTATTGISINNTGGDGAHNNMQPSTVVNKIIKT